MLTVHPRLCGEHQGAVAGDGSGDGSSPPVRGTPDRGREARLPIRFIPACAGNTGDSRPTPHTVPVHPRLCGEHCRSGIGDVHRLGSSPPVRGTLAPGAVGSRQSRFIPACAGNTSGQVMSAATLPVHPRLCGEHSASARGFINRFGSSPPVRGTRGHGHGGARRLRFIPACAGNTRAPSPVTEAVTVHPRLCGEHCDECKAPGR